VLAPIPRANVNTATAVKPGGQRVHGVTDVLSKLLQQATRTYRPHLLFDLLDASELHERLPPGFRRRKLLLDPLLS